MNVSNLFENLPVAWPDECSTVLLQQTGLRVERIISQGQASPNGFWYDQAEDELVFLLQGAAQLQWADESLRCLKPGDWLLIPAHTRHRIAWTDPQQPSLWLAIFWSPTGKFPNQPLGTPPASS